MSRIIKVIDKRGLGKTTYFKRRYKLKESVKGALCLGIIAAIIITTLMIQTKRVEDLDNTGDTETKAIQVQLTR